MFLGDWTSACRAGQASVKTGSSARRLGRKNVPAKKHASHRDYGHRLRRPALDVGCRQKALGLRVLFLSTGSRLRYFRSALTNASCAGHALYPCPSSAKDVVRRPWWPVLEDQAAAHLRSLWPRHGFRFAAVVHAVENPLYARDSFCRSHNGTPLALLLDAAGNFNDAALDV